jgi:hypothetical protein
MTFFTNTVIGQFILLITCLVALDVLAQIFRAIAERIGDGRKK